MTLNTREKRTIGIGAAALAVVFLYSVFFSDSDGSAMAARDTLAGAFDRIEEYERKRDSVARLSEELGVKIPSVAPTEQEVRIREDLQTKSRTNGLALGNLKLIDTGRRNSEAQAKPIRFRIELKGNFESVIGFIYALENADVPYVVSDVQINSSTAANRSSRGGPQGAAAPQNSGTPQPSGRGGRSPTGQVSVTMKVQSYVFPDVAIAPKPPEEEDADPAAEEAAAEADTPPAETPEPDAAFPGGLEEVTIEYESGADIQVFSIGGDLTIGPNMIGQIQQMAWQMLDGMSDEDLVAMLSSLPSEFQDQMPDNIREMIESGNIDRDALIDSMEERFEDGFSFTQTQP